MKITHKQARKHIENQIILFNELDVRTFALHDLLNYIAQQEKIEKLLELYRKTTLQGKYEDVLMIAKLEKELENELK